MPSWELDAFQPEVEAGLARAIGEGPGVAVFDADHTLWHHDTGEEFHAYLASARLLPGMAPGRDLVAEYRSLERSDPEAAYTSIVTQMSGMAEARVRELAEGFFAREFAGRVFPAQRRLLSRLAGAGWETWIVSASNRWIVQAAALALGLPRERIVGVDLVEREGVLTPELAHPLTYAEGKCRAIERCIGRMPDLVAGDSFGDVPMLCTARRAALLLAYPAASPSLIATARERGWLVQPVRRAAASA